MVAKVIVARSMDRSSFCVGRAAGRAQLARPNGCCGRDSRSSAAVRIRHRRGLSVSLHHVLPIPMGNMPPAIAICLFSLAILDRDGVWVLAGLCATAASIAIVWGVLFALIKGALLLL